jgi:uncharacterized protein (UPF0128 family)
MENNKFCKVLIVETKYGKRFFNKYNKKSNRISTAWHLSAAKLFHVDFYNSQDICINIFNIIKNKGYKCYFRNLILNA